MKRILLIVLGALIAALVIVWIVGALLPRDHVATSRARYSQPPQAVWDAITDFEGMLAWWSGVQSVERGADWKGQPVWVLTSGFGPLPLAVLESDPPRRMLSEIASDELGFGGTWTWQIEPHEAGCTLTITERGTVDNAFFRCMSRFVMGHHGTIDGLLRDLGKKFAEEVEPLHIVPGL